MDKEYIEKGQFDHTLLLLGYAEKDLPRRALAQQAEADVAPVVHGRWEERVLYDDIVCTECGHSWNVIDNCTKTFNFCPNCGAKMDGADGNA